MVFPMELLAYLVEVGIFLAGAAVVDQGGIGAVQIRL